MWSQLNTEEQSLQFNFQCSSDCEINITLQIVVKNAIKLGTYCGARVHHDSLVTATHGASVHKLIETEKQVNNRTSGTVVI